MQTGTTEILPTANEAWGFFGTIRHHADPDAAWALASAAIAMRTDGSAEAVRDFLDSRHGRHFADDVADALLAGHGLAAAIERAVERWMKWRIGRNLSAETGIPQDLPYLAGFVTHFEILADAAT